MDKRRNSMENRKILGKEDDKQLRWRGILHLKGSQYHCRRHIWMTPRVQQSSKTIQEGSHGIPVKPCEAHSARRQSGCFSPMLKRLNGRCTAVPESATGWRTAEKGRWSPDAHWPSIPRRSSASQRSRGAHPTAAKESDEALERIPGLIAVSALRNPTIDLSPFFSRKALRANRRHARGTSGRRRCVRSS